MGCVSSKVVSRSSSFRQQLNLLQGKPIGIRSGCSGSSTSESNPSEKADVNLDRNESSGTWELTARLEQEMEKQMQPPSTDTDLAKRPKHCRWFQDQHVSSRALRRPAGTNEERSMWSNSRAIRAGSFHTVEEYDAMIERICISMEDQIDIDAKKDGFLQPHHCKSSSCSPEHDEQDILSSSRPQSSGTGNPSNSGTTEGTQNSEKGFRRKAKANELESLEVPTTMEFQSVASASLGEFLHVGGHVYSPGAYVTPKFGSYRLPNDSGSANEGFDSTFFDPELVAAFEKCMEQLEVEEESNLKQIEENFKGESAKEKQDREEIPFRTNDQ